DRLLAGGKGGVREGCNSSAQGSGSQYVRALLEVDDLSVGRGAIAGTDGRREDYSLTINGLSRQRRGDRACGRGLDELIDRRGCARHQAGTASVYRCDGVWAGRQSRTGERRSAAAERFRCKNYRAIPKSYTARRRAGTGLQ